MNWKQLIALALVVVVAGCGGPSESGKGSATPEPGPKTEGGAPLQIGMVFDQGGLGDKSFNDSANRGLERAKAELGIDAKTVQSRQVSDYEKNLESLAANKVPLVFAIGISMKEAVEKVAPKFPDTKFALVDEMVDSPNVRGLKFKEEEGSFLAGYLAGLMTKTGKIGFIGGKDIDLIKKFEVGFHAGAKTANSKVEMAPVKFVGDWNDPATAKQIAKTLYGQGVDIIYHASGGSGKGVFEAAKEANAYAIGVDSDQDDIVPGQILTSMIKRVDEAVFATVKDFKDGKFEAGSKVYDLASNGVGLSEMKHTKDKVGAENLAKIEEVKGKIASGEIKVPATAEELAAFMAKGAK